MSEHTQGPWLPQIWGDGSISIEAPGSITIARINDNDAEANARLIAAAPELLDACELLVAHMVDIEAVEDMSAGTKIVYGQGIAALKKARGSK